MVSDKTLVSGTLAGDRSAFAELYDRRAPLIRAICFEITRDFDTAADLTQEVFLRAYEGLSSLRDPDRFVAWLAGIARTVCRDWQRGYLREQRRFVSLSTEPCDPRPGKVDERLTHLEEALERLPRRERLSVRAFYLQGHSVEEARAVLGLSRASLYRVLARARQHLRRLMSGLEVRS